MENTTDEYFELDISEEDIDFADFLVKLDKDAEEYFELNRRICKIFPDDMGLTYCIIYNDLIEGSTTLDLQTHTLKDFIRVCMSRRDYPEFVKDRMFKYIGKLWQCEQKLYGREKSDEDFKRAWLDDDEFIPHKISTFIESVHQENVAKVIQFYRLIDDDDESDFINAVFYHFQHEKEGTNFREFTKSSDSKNLLNIDDFVKDIEPSQTVEWFDIDKMRSHLLNSEQSDNKYLLSKLARGSYHVKQKLIIENEKVFNDLLTEFPNFSDVINFYKAQFRLSELTNRERITPILLAGPPGIGKSQFSKSLAQSLKTSYTLIDIGSATAVWVLSGTHATWKGAKIGKVFEAMMNSTTASPVVVLDEIEKPSRANEDPRACLYQLLEENGSTSFVDEFVDFPADLSRIIYIACANDVSTLSDPLLSRFKVFDIPIPSIEQHAIIVQNIYRKEISGSDLFEPELDDRIVELFSSDSLRAAKVKISDAIGAAVLELSQDEIAEIGKTGPKIRVEHRHVKNHHKPATKIGF